MTSLNFSLDQWRQKTRTFPWYISSDEPQSQWSDNTSILSRNMNIFNALQSKLNWDFILDQLIKHLLKYISWFKILCSLLSELNIPRRSLPERLKYHRPHIMFFSLLDFDEYIITMVKEYLNNEDLWNIAKTSRLLQWKYSYSNKSLIMSYTFKRYRKKSTITLFKKLFGARKIVQILLYDISLWNADYVLSLMKLFVLKNVSCHKNSYCKMNKIFAYGLREMIFGYARDDKNIFFNLIKLNHAWYHSLMNKKMLDSCTWNKKIIINDKMYHLFNHRKSSQFIFENVTEVVWNVKNPSNKSNYTYFKNLTVKNVIIYEGLDFRLSLASCFDKPSLAILICNVNIDCTPTWHDFSKEAYFLQRDYFCHFIKNDITESSPHLYDVKFNIFENCVISKERLFKLSNRNGIESPVIVMWNCELVSEPGEETGWVYSVNTSYQNDITLILLQWTKFDQLHVLGEADKFNDSIEEFVLHADLDYVNGEEKSIVHMLKLLIDAQLFGYPIFDNLLRVKILFTYSKKKSPNQNDYPLIDAFLERVHHYYNEIHAQFDSFHIGIGLMSENYKESQGDIFDVLQVQQFQIDIYRWKWNHLLFHNGQNNPDAMMITWRDIISMFTPI